jgi:hypothetical protein
MLSAVGSVNLSSRLFFSAIKEYTIAAVDSGGTHTRTGLVGVKFDDSDSENIKKTYTPIADTFHKAQTPKTLYAGVTQ